MTLPVVLVHGIRVSRTMWEPVVGELDRPALALDLPGHGARRGETFTMAAATGAVADAVDRLGGRALLAGLSLGGFVGIAAAGRFPERVAGLVAIGCTARPARLVGLYRGAAALAARFPEQANRFSAYAFRRALPRPAADAVVAGGLSSEVMPAVVAAVAGHDQLAALAGYPGPVWLVNGDRDPFRADERAYLAACRDGRLIRLPRAGHVTTLADPVRLARLIEDAAAHAERHHRAAR
ncbi:alpha/beta hydrolase [Micromonospora sp. C28SCA-DRY-2]|uniref:alpha/beta fold hydrolase n=1 Tax=Micromonospora sp. C28SCA-DRY-2 TaxID=3059522 RepID=UPI0026751F5E|nr:alpha/beta hydrolase [Micromonospora sp. C28SCA-DRY-2]MDO3705064.1 alpha/beta hydrolase [Micromonospora sp. C28SCA-DRY-2]